VLFGPAGRAGKSRNVGFGNETFKGKKKRKNRQMPPSTGWKREGYRESKKKRGNARKGEKHGNKNSAGTVRGMRHDHWGLTKAETRNRSIKQSGNSNERGGQSTWKRVWGGRWQKTQGGGNATDHKQGLQGGRRGITLRRSLTVGKTTTLGGRGKKLL